MVSKKTCALCKRNLLRTLFHRRAKAPDGLQEVCVGCSRLRDRQRRARLSEVERGNSTPDTDEPADDLSHRLVRVDWPLLRKGCD